MVLELDLPNRPPPNRVWRLNPLLLSDDRFVEFISDQINFFLETNTSPEISNATLWETLKGHIIAYSSRINREKYSKLQEISHQIAIIDSKYVLSPTPDLYKERLRLQTEHNLLTTDEATRLILNPGIMSMNLETKRTSSWPCKLVKQLPLVTCASLPNSAQVVIAFSTLLARRLILLKWKQHSPPSFSQWVKDVMYFLQLEKIKFLLRGSSNTFIRTWKPFLDFYDSLQDPLDKE
ncbi:hypothetical protein F7725_008300 [Dissostichus mawsoni]|uniref:Uncharacterized protein n=1 Tax=Dissostichus mawsoni TaxID=36200 RepID=A0A7J5Y984_DISMA|nr:hypothetical protein F7725_008300 [Dissostichus mawsoni]